MSDKELITALLSLLDLIEVQNDASLAAGRFEICKQVLRGCFYGRRSKRSCKLIT